MTSRHIDPLKRVADVLSNADALLITTGAGMGVDSGLGTFRGRNAGVWAPLKALQMDFSQMSCPDWFTKDPHLAWAFWHFRHQAYTKGSPHAGYDILAKWGVGMKYGLFSVTSNIDGHWERIAQVGSLKVCEVHGAVTHMQCVDESNGKIWETIDSEISKMKVPAWDLKPGEKVEAFTETGWVPASVGEDGATIMPAAGNDATCTHKPLQVIGVRRPGTLEDLCRVSKGSELPKCPETGKPARPNVLMFGDWGVNCERIEMQEARFEVWTNSLPRDVQLVVVEVGAGNAVATIRRTSEYVVRQFPESTLVRINLDDYQVPSDLKERSIQVGGLGALDALSQIDALLKGMKQ